MQHLDEGTIHAWLDGALSADESARVERHTAECADCASLVAEARGLVAGASRILSALDDTSSVVPAAGSGLSAGSGWRVAGGGDRAPHAEVAPSNARATTRPEGARPQPATRSWFRPATLAAAASVILMVGSAVVLTKSGGPNSVASRAVDSVPAAAPTSEADALRGAAGTAQSAAPESAAGPGLGAAIGSGRGTANATPQPAPQPRVGAASRDDPRQASASRVPASGPEAGRVARAFARDSLVRLDEQVVTTAAPIAAPVTAQETAPAARKGSVANEKAAVSAEAAVPVPLAPPPAADVAVTQRSGAPEGRAARRAAAAPARSEQQMAAAAEVQPTVRVDTVFIPGRVDTVTLDPPDPPIGTLRSGPPRRPTVYPVTGCYVVVEGGLSDTLTLTKVPAWSGAAESRRRVTAPGAIGFWSQPPNGDVHIEISGALVTARIDPSTGDLRGRVRRGGASEPFLARRCR